MKSILLNYAKTEEFVGIKKACGKTASLFEKNINLLIT